MVDKTQFSKDFDETFGSRFLNNSKLNNTNLNNSTILKTDIFNETSNNSFRLDLIYLNNVINDCKGQIKEGEDYEIISRNYQNLISSMSRKFENNYLKNLTNEKKGFICRESARLFDQEPIGNEFKSKIRRIVNWRLDQMKRDTKDYKWNLIKTTILSLIYKNKDNRDLFECISMREIPNDLRQTVWRLFLEDENVSQEYKKQLESNKILTISQFDHQISRDCEEFILKMTEKEEFDGSMVFCMKTILSYYEKKKDRILSDYLYQLCIPLVFVFGNLRTLHGKPGELISYFINIQKIVYEFDPLVDLIVKHDVSYDALMTDFFMNSMSLVDEDLTKKIIEILNLDLESDRKLLVLLVKKFVHSLGFGFLSMRITLFVWDQLFMKLKRNRAEIFLIMAISFFCLKNEILECKNWDHLLNCYYGKAKNIDFNSFFIKYIEIFHNIMFYTSEYDLPLEKKEVLVSQTKKIDNINDSFNEINKNNEINIKEELNKKEFKPIYGSNIKKSERPEIIQPNFISKLNKNQKEINDISNLNDKEISKNIIKLDSDNKSDIGLLSDINKKQKHNIMSGFQIKK